MKAAVVRGFGPPSVIAIDDLPRTKPSRGQLLVRVCAAGVGNWDALIRKGKSGLDQPLPLILGSELAGTVEAAGDGVVGFEPGDEVYGATNERFTGADAEYALASAGMIAHKPGKLCDIETASSLVGARRASLHTIATAGAADLKYVKSLGAEQVVDYRATRFEDAVRAAYIVLDTVGGDTQQRSLSIVNPGGILVSVVSRVPGEAQQKFGVRTSFFFVEVTTGRLNKIAQLFDEGALVPRVGTVLPLADVRAAHEMLDGAPHKPGKIVLQVARSM